MGRAAEWFFGGLTRRYGQVLEFSLGHRWLTGGLALLVCISLPLLYSMPKRELAPTEDQAAVLTAIKAPQHRQPRLRRTVRAQARPGLHQHPGNREHLDHQRHRRTGGELRRDQPGGLGKTRARRLGDPVRAARQGRRRRGQQHLRLPVGRPARLHRRPAGADGAAQPAGLSGALPDHGRDQAEGPTERAVRSGRQRPRLQQPGGPGPHRPRQGQQPGHPHAGHRRVAGGAGGRELCQPLRHGGPLLRRDPTEPARPAFHSASAGTTVRAHPGRQPGAAVDGGPGGASGRTEQADPVRPAERRDPPGDPRARRLHGPGGGLPRRRGARPAGRLQPRLAIRLAAIHPGRQHPGVRLPRRPGGDLPGARRAVRAWPTR